jgi:NIPSNAP
MLKNQAFIGLAVAIVTALKVSAASAQSEPAQPTTAEKKPQKIYELRIYTANPGKLPDLHARFRDHTMKLFEKHGMENIIYWTLAEDFNDESKDNTLVYILAHKSKKAAEASWKSFHEDPEWQAVAAKSEENGKLLANAPVSVFLNPTDFNPDEEPINAKSETPARLFELRRYNDGEARVPSTVNRFKTWEADLFRQSGIETLDFWTTEDNTAFVYLLGHKDRATADRNWQAFFAGFRARGSNPPAQAGNNGDAAQDRNAGTQSKGPRGGSGGGIERRWLVPTDYSPRK